MYVEPRGDRLYLGLLAVDPAHQQRGLGAMMMKRAEEHARSRGCGGIDIRIVNLRTELPEFYARLGYVATGQEPFDGRTTSDAPCYFIRMAKTLA